MKIAEGCDRRCAYCAIPSFRGAQRSRPTEAVLEEIDALGPAVAEVVLVAQDLASWGLDRSDPGERTRDARGRSCSCSSGSPSASNGSGSSTSTPRRSTTRSSTRSARPGCPTSTCRSSTSRRALRADAQARSQGALHGSHRAHPRAAPDAALRSSFILGFPGETEEDHDELLGFLEEMELDWAGFFTFSEEPGTPAEGLEPAVPRELALDRLRECSEIQDAVTARRRQSLVGSTLSVLVDSPGVGRSYREAPEIDGVIHVPTAPRDRLHRGGGRHGGRGSRPVGGIPDPILSDSPRQVS